METSTEENLDEKVKNTKIEHGRRTKAPIYPLLHEEIIDDRYDSLNNIFYPDNLYLF